MGPFFAPKDHRACVQLPGRIVAILHQTFGSSDPRKFATGHDRWLVGLPNELAETLQNLGAPHFDQTTILPMGEKKLVLSSPS